MKPRLNYEYSCRKLQGVYFPPGEMPLLPDRVPRYDDKGPLGVSFFRTCVGKEDAWSNLTLPRTFFGRSKIEGAQFQNTDFTESSMCWNDFIDVDFTDAILARSLLGSVFVRVNFTRADLRGADLRCSSFDKCDFSEALMAGTILTRRQGTKWCFSPLKFSNEQREVIAWADEQGPLPGGG